MNSSSRKHTLRTLDMMEELGHCSAKVEMLAGLVQQLLAFSHHSGCSAGWLHVQSVFVCGIYIYTYKGFCL